MIFTKEDIKYAESLGKTQKQLEQQLERFSKGFPFLEIIAPATTKKGVLVLSDTEKESYLKLWNQTVASGATICKFVPASGAASRMFKDLYSFTEASYNEPTTVEEKKFFDNLTSFAFYTALNEACIQNKGKSISQLIDAKDYKTVVNLLLGEEGLNYGNLPKGLLKFHLDDTTCYTPVEEHLKEGALYAKEASGISNVHFTISPEHRLFFESLVESKKEILEGLYNTSYNISFSEQKKSTDTLAVDLENKPFRVDGELFFRPGGHGALIENLNDLSYDFIFIKNIDNVIPDRIKNIEVDYKKILAGVLVDIQHNVFKYLNLLDDENVSSEQLKQILAYVEKDLCITVDDASLVSESGFKSVLRGCLNRPIRVAGMVKNLGEPGGGPFLVLDSKGGVGSQILESSQIDSLNKTYGKMLEDSTHFNPVDLVCAVNDYKGAKFDLLDYVDEETGFISIKSKDGQELKALELPGLWNGAMSDWITIFVEIPVDVFNPVKTVNDLLRKNHIR